MSTGVYARPEAQAASPVIFTCPNVGDEFTIGSYIETKNPYAKWQIISDDYTPLPNGKKFKIKQGDSKVKINAGYASNWYRGSQSSSYRLECQASFIVDGISHKIYIRTVALYSRCEYIGDKKFKCSQ